MKKNYTGAEIEIALMDLNDVITTSFTKLNDNSGAEDGGAFNDIFR